VNEGSFFVDKIYNAQVHYFSLQKIFFICYNILYFKGRRFFYKAVIEKYWKGEEAWKKKGI